MIRTCNKCVMDETDPEIEFDSVGVCNHCHRHDYLAKSYPRNVDETLKQVAEDGKGEQYDCIIGVSGGVDSSYVLHTAKLHGLRPLAVSVNNHWDTPEAGENVKIMLSKLNVPLEVVTIDWDKYRQCQVALLKSGTPDVELITDHAIIAALYQKAIEHGVKWILTGSNYQSESHLAWSYDLRDWLYIRSLCREFGFKGDFNWLPHFGYAKGKYYKQTLKVYPMLNHMDYNKDSIKQMLITTYGYKDYGGKHHESLWTKFFQEYYLPKRFGYDKRKCHLSALISSGFITREQALEELKKPHAEFDMDAILKKLELTEADWESIMNGPKHTYKDFPNYGKFNNYYFRKRWRGLK